MRRHQRPWTGRNVVRRDRRRYDLDFKIVNPRVFPLIQYCDVLLNTLTRAVNFLNNLNHVNISNIYFHDPQKKITLKKIYYRGILFTCEFSLFICIHR